MLAAGGLLFGRRALLLARLVRLGKPVRRSGDTPRRVRNEVVLVLGQRKLFQKLVPGLMHAFIFWGFLVLLPTVVIAMIGAVDRHTTFPWLGGQGWYASLVDAFCVLVLAGVATALVIRKVVRPRRFHGSHLREADLILAAIAGIVATLLLWHAARIALGLNEAGRGWAPVSGGIAHAFGTGEATRVLERVLVWAHIVLILGFLAYLPHSKHLHIVTAGVNAWFGRTRSRGRLEPLRFDEEDVADEDIRFGTATVADMTWKQMVDVLSCTECGRCQDVCPAYATGKELSPKLLVMGLRDRLFEEGPLLLAAAARGEAPAATPLVPTAVSDEVLWDCVTCGACIHECPVSIEHVDHIVDLRRNLVMVESRFPTAGETMMRDLARASNPWGKPQAERAAWAEGLDVRVLEPGDPVPEVLYWVGCAPSYDERAREGARSTVKLLTAAGVDFAILGARECCTGDPARRLGDEYVFQELARRNVETLAGAGVTKIVASCPHCYNTLANEYADFGGSYEVMHHTELLARLVREGLLSPTATGAGVGAATGAAGGAAQGTITYHDSCYLARHNDVRTQPRELVAAIGTPVEMPRHGERTFCCGAGGAHMWLEERGSQINEARVEEAAATGASTLAVACPFCTVMLDDGVKATGRQLRVVDVATLLAEAIELPAAPAAGAPASTGPAA